MRNFNDIMNEKNLKVKEFENNKILKEKINNQWKEIENNIDNAEIKHNTKRIPLCKHPLYEENKNRLINEHGFKNKYLKHYLENWYIELLDDINLNTQEKTLKECVDKAKEAWTNKTIDEKIKEYNEYQNKIKNVQESQKEELKGITNELNKYNLNDGQHEQGKIDDVFGKRNNKENNINIDKSNNKNDKTILQMYKYKDGEFKKINLDENNNDIKQQSKEDKLETFADLINHVLGFKYC